MGYYHKLKKKTDYRQEMRSKNPFQGASKLNNISQNCLMSSLSDSHSSPDHMKPEAKITPMNPNHAGILQIFRLSMN